jgi:hypothetical protein
MDLLERIFGVETMARARAAAREAQSRANAAAVALPMEATPRRASAPASRGPGAAIPRPQVQTRPNARVPFDDAPSASPAVDFPTSILGTTDAARPPLLAAYASRDAVLAAIVYSEALAPPVALR